MRAPRRAPGGPRGYTLIELAVVIALLGLTFGLISAVVVGWSPAGELREVREIERDLAAFMARAADEDAVLRLVPGPAGRSLVAAGPTSTAGSADVGSSTLELPEGWSIVAPQRTWCEVADLPADLVEVDGRGAHELLRELPLGCVERSVAGAVRVEPLGPTDGLLLERREPSAEPHLWGLSWPSGKLHRIGAIDDRRAGSRERRGGGE